jgi:hypothetical protein
MSAGRVLPARRAAAGLALVTLLLPGLADAADPDWPCVQRLVPELAMGQMWAGPPPVEEAWQADPEIAALAPELARVETPIEAATEHAASFAAAQPDGQRDARLALLFRATLEIINGERSTLIEGIKRYARGQRALAERIAVTGSALEGLPPGPDVVPPPELAPLKQQRDWDIRIFEERQKSLRYLCDQPVMLEQRAFALGRALGALLS